MSVLYFLFEHIKDKHKDFTTEDQFIRLKNKPNSNHFVNETLHLPLYMGN